MGNQGWIRMWRRLEDWEWYKTPNMVHLFSHLIMRANHEGKNWQGNTIERGQLITSLDSLKSQTGISIRSLRTCLGRLSDTGEISQKTTNRYRHITICNYNRYQNRELPADKQTTNKRQTNDKQTTTNKNVKNVKNVKNDKNTTLFDIFWKSYPRKVNKTYACKVFKRINPSKQLLEKILSAIEEQKNTVDWKKENGQFIPHPSTWLNGERWRDELFHQESIPEKHKRLKAKGEI